MSTATNILGKIGEKVGEEIKALRVSLGTQISQLNLNDITGGLNVTKDANGLGISTDGKGVFNSLEVSLGSTLHGAVTANSSITALGQISALRATTTQDLSVGTDASIGGDMSVTGKLTAGSLEVQGETKIINTTSVEVSDNILELNKSSDNSTTASISGIEINRGEVQGTTGGAVEGIAPLEMDITTDTGVNKTNVRVDFEQMTEYVGGFHAYFNLETDFGSDGKLPANSYRIVFRNNLTKHADTQNVVTYDDTISIPLTHLPADQRQPLWDNLPADQEFGGWVLEKYNDTSSVFEDFIEITDTSGQFVSHEVTVTHANYNVSSEDGGTGQQLHGAFQVTDDNDTFHQDSNDLSGVFVHNPFMRGLYDGDTLKINNISSETIYIHSTSDTNAFTLEATITNGSSHTLTAIGSENYFLSKVTDMNPVQNESGAMNFYANPDARDEVAILDPAILGLIIAEGINRPIFQKLENYIFGGVNSAQGQYTSTTLFSTFEGNGVAFGHFYSENNVAKVLRDDPLAYNLRTQQLPLAQSTETSTNDKARFIWDNAEDQQKFKILVGDALADLSCDDLSSNVVTVPNGNGVVIGTAPIGTYADFTNALATAKI
jgi:hypothetical protein